MFVLLRWNYSVRRVLQEGEKGFSRYSEIIWFMKVKAKDELCTTDLLIVTYARIGSISDRKKKSTTNWLSHQVDLYNQDATAYPDNFNGRKERKSCLQDFENYSCFVCLTNYGCLTLCYYISPNLLFHCSTPCMQSLSIYLKSLWCLQNCRFPQICIEIAIWDTSSIGL